MDSRLMDLLNHNLKMGAQHTEAAFAARRIANAYVKDGGCTK